MDWISAIAQTPAPTAQELELLRQQIDFLKEANTDIEDTFARYVNMVQLTVATAGGIVGVVAVLGTAVSIKSLQDFRATLKSVNIRVRDEVEQAIAIALRQERQRLRRLEGILAREDIPERLSLTYLVPRARPQRQLPSLTRLLDILAGRGFQPKLSFQPGFSDPVTAQQQPDLTTDIVVLDLYHGGFALDTERANPTIQAVAAKLPSQQAALVVYGNARFYQAVTDLTERGEYCGASNNPLSLVARVLEAAYVIDAVRAG